MCCPNRGLACVAANGVSGRCACDSVGQWNERMWNPRKQLARLLCDYLVFMTAGCPCRGRNWNWSNCPARRRSQLLMWTQGSESVGISSRKPSPKPSCSDRTLSRSFSHSPPLFTFWAWESSASLNQRRSCPHGDPGHALGEIEVGSWQYPAPCVFLSG